MKDTEITMRLGEMTVGARMVQRDIIYSFLKIQISQTLIMRIKTVEYEIKAKQ